MYKKLLRALLLIVLPACFVGQAMGQKVEPYDFVGDDLIKILSEGESTTLTIGKQGNTKECVYEWDLESRPDGTSFPIIAHSTHPQTDITLYEVGSYVFRLTRVSKYGYQREYVTVSLYDHITLISAKLVYPDKCWSPGDAVHEYDFEFETEPPGYEDRIRVSAQCASIPDAFYELVPFKDYEISFTVDGQNGLQAVKAVVTVIKRNELFSITTSLGTSNTPKKMKENLALLREAVSIIKDAKRFTDNVEKYDGFVKKLGKVSKINPIHDLDFVPTFGVKFDCCDGDAGTYLVLGGVIRFSLGIGWDVPIPAFYIPGLGGLAVWGSAKVMIDVFPGPNMSIPLSTTDFSNCFQTTVLVPVSALVEIRGGMEAVSADIASVGVGIESDFNASFKLHTSKPYIETPKAVDIQVYAKLEVNFLSTTTSLFKYQLYPELKQIE